MGDSNKKATQEAQAHAKGLKEMATSLQTVGAAMTAMGGVALAGLGSAAQSFANFDASLKNIQISTGATSTEIEAMSNKITELGNGATSIDQITKGFGHLADQGASLQEINTIMEQATTLMSGFGASAETASGILQTAVRAYGVSLGDLSGVTDKLAEASKTIRMDELANQLKQVGPAASTAGVSLEETVAALMSLKDKGMTAEQSVQGLQRLMIELAKPSDNLKKTFRELGVSLDRLQDPTASLSDKISLLKDAGFDAGKALEIFGNRAGPAVAKLLEGGSDAIEDYIDQLENSGGAAQDAAKIMEGSFKGAVQSMQNSFTSLKNSIGQAVAPLFKGIADAVKGLVQWFDRIPGPVKEVAVQFGAVVAIGATVVGTLSLIAGTVIKTVDNFKTFGGIVKKIFTTDLPALGTSIASTTRHIIDLGAAAGKQIFAALQKGAGLLANEIKKTAQAFSGFQGMVKAGIAVASIVAFTAAMQPLIKAMQEARSEAEELKNSLENMGVDIELSGLEEFVANIVSLGGLIPGVKEGLEATFIANRVTEYNKELMTNMDLMSGLLDLWGDFQGGKITLEEFVTAYSELNSKIDEVSNAAGGMAQAFGNAHPAFTKLRDHIDEEMTKSANIVDEKTREAVGAIEHAFENIKVRPDLLPAEVVADFNQKLGMMNFETLEESAKKASQAINGFFDALGKEVAAKLGVIDGFEFSTIPGKAAAAAKDILSAFADVGVDSKSALDIINTIDFGGLAVSVDDAKKRIVDSLMAVGYSAQEAEKFVNEVDFDGLKSNADNMKDDVVGAFAAAKKNALEELEEINNQKFDRLQANLAGAIKEATAAAVQDLGRMGAAIAELQGKQVNVGFSFVEVGG